MRTLISIIMIVVAVVLTMAAELDKKGDAKDEEGKDRMLPDVPDNLRKYFEPLAQIAFVMAILVSSVYSVNESQAAVVTMFGKAVKVESAGIHFKAPFVQKVKKLDISTHGQSIGYEIKDSTQTYGNKENPLMITSDFNLINLDLYMEYRINDPIAFIYNAEDPELILTNEAMSSIRGIVSDYNVDDVMTTAKTEIQQKIKESVSKKLEKRQVGLQLINVLIQDVEPPTIEVADAFKSVETSKQKADTSINNATRYQNEQIPNAEAQADKIIQEATAKKESRIAEAEGQVARFNKMYDEYSKYPLITKKRMFYETMEELLPDMKIIITDGNTQTLMPSSLLNIGGEE